MVEIFKTNITDAAIAERTLEELLEYFPLSKINFDLNDCDNILRIECQNIITNSVIAIMKNLGFCCEVIE